MTDLPIRMIFPAHRFLEADRGTDSLDGKEGICDYYHRDGSSGEYCSEAYRHSVHHGVDSPRFEHSWGEDR
jgi:hypothetical protein